ncbi:MAG: carbohydrate ABC transporter permease [Ruminiclostridium sp.]|nr:carbohydrate ABC transporter permease [Ruminiclostridium sp.]
MKDSISRKIFIVCNYIFFIIFSLTIILPFINIITISLSETKMMGFQLFPSKLYFGAYKDLFTRGSLVRPFVNSIIITVMGLATSLFFTITFGYAIMKKDLIGLNVILVIIMIPYFFNGGMIPNYLLVRDLKLINTYWAVVLPKAIGFTYLLLARNYFRSLPESLSESARMDGAGEWRILFKIMLPLSKPIIAAISLFYGVSYWNEWFKVILYIYDQSKFTFQVVLRNLVVESQNVQTGTGTQEVGENIKMAMTLVGMIPILIVYPLLQKHFAKGILVGSVKG